MYIHIRTCIGIKTLFIFRVWWKISGCLYETFRIFSPERVQRVSSGIIELKVDRTWVLASLTKNSFVIYVRGGAR